jgi:hypothetical protein
MKFIVRSDKKIIIYKTKIRLNYTHNNRNGCGTVH